MGGKGGNPIGGPGIAPGGRFAGIGVKPGGGGRITVKPGGGGGTSGLTDSIVCSIGRGGARGGILRDIGGRGGSVCSGGGGPSHESNETVK